MGRKAYLTRLALGRSAYAPFPNEEVPAETEESGQALPTEVDGHSRDIQIEPRLLNSTPYVQQFDDRGHPQNLASRAFSRASRRAQNDLLASLGYLDVTDESTKGSTDITTSKDGVTTDRRYGEIEDEADDGSLVDAAVSAASGFVDGRFTYLRNRLQTFRFYAGVPLPRLLQGEWANAGPLLLLFGGLPGDFLVTLSRKSVLQSFILHQHKKYVVSRIRQLKSPSIRYLLRCSVGIVRYCLWIYYLTVIATLQFHSILQGLGLKSLRSFLPGPMALVPFTPASLIQPISLPAELSVSSMIHYLVSLAGSPVVLISVFGTARRFIHGKAYEYFKLATPKPDNPDRGSIEVALRRREHAYWIPGLNFRYDEKKNLSIEDIKTVREVAAKDWATFRDRMASTTLWYKVMILKTSISSMWYPSPKRSIREDQSASASTHPFEPAQEQPRSTSPSPADDRGIRDSVTNTYSLDSLSKLAPTLAQYLYTFHETSRPTHRVTLLSNFATNAISFLLSDVITQTLLLPLEALLVRSVALAYLSNSDGGSTSSLWLRNEIYPLGSWFGMGLRGGRAMDYARKMTLCFAMEMAVGYGVWQIGVGAAWRLGNTMHGWGKLKD